MTCPDWAGFRVFRRLPEGEVRAEHDLRRLGWVLVEQQAWSDGLAPCPLLVETGALTWRERRRLAAASRDSRRLTLVLDLADPAERARLLRLGFGDALGPGCSLAEIEARALRLIERTQSLPRLRQIGAMRLDLLAREAFVAERPLGLHPREFALLWRLADEPGSAVPAAVLLRNIWRLGFRPETNSLAVHVSRLRAKLRVCGLAGLVETDERGGYRLRETPAAAHPAHPAIALPTGPAQFALDAHVRLGKEQGMAAPAAGGRAEAKDDDHAA